MNTFLQIIHILFLSVPLLYAGANSYDLTLIGYVKYADGLGRIPIGLIDILKNDLKINCIPIMSDLSNLDPEMQNVICDPDHTAGRVSLLTSPIFWSTDFLFYEYVPDSKIKIALSMFESTRIPSRWAEILNEKFDAVVVPDAHLKKYYKNSGVQIPIFVIPLGMDLSEFFDINPHSSPSLPFVFGTSANLFPHKNLKLIMQAFAEEFKNSDEVILKIHGRMGEVEILQNFAQMLNLTNVEFTTGALNQREYIERISKLDCYINISKGEGFSCCPREALALGIPCIVSCNTAQQTICDSGFVRSVKSEIEEPAHYGVPYYDSHAVGNHYNCHLEDVKEAMRDVYTHYPQFLKLAHAGRKWVRQYTWSHLKPKFLNLVKPKKVFFGKKNLVTDKFLVTNSQGLFMKYLQITQQNKR